MQNWWSNYAKMKARCAVDYEFKIFFRKANNCLLPNAELNLLPTFGKYRFHSTRRAKTPSKRAAIDLRLSFLPREAFIFGNSTKTEPLHDLRQRTVHQEVSLHYEAKVGTEHTAWLQVGWLQCWFWSSEMGNVLSFGEVAKSSCPSQVVLSDKALCKHHSMSEVANLMLVVGGDAN